MYEWPERKVSNIVTKSVAYSWHATWGVTQLIFYLVVAGEFYFPSSFFKKIELTDMETFLSYKFNFAVAFHCFSMWVLVFCKFLPFLRDALNPSHLSESMLGLILL